MDDALAGFTLIKNYKALKLPTHYTSAICSFTLIKNYKALKLSPQALHRSQSFTLIKNYKALKPGSDIVLFISEFYTYKKLQGSQT